jgi:ornithine decarboxylase
MDHMAGPFILPDDVQAGDYIEVGMIGAYGCAMRTEFNGFGETETVGVRDLPWTSMYGPLVVEKPARRVSRKAPRRLKVVR